MTASTQGFTAQGLAGSGILPHLGTAQQYGFPTPGWPQGPYGMQAPYGQVPWSPAQAQFGSQALPGFSQGPAGQVAQQQIQQAFLQLIGQILPIAQQMIL